MTDAPRLTYAAGAGQHTGLIHYMGRRHLDRNWAERMRAYHVAQIATPGISDERRQNNERWLAEIDAAMAIAFPATLSKQAAE